MSGAVLAVFFIDGLSQGVFIGDDESFGFEVLVDVQNWREEFE